MCPKMTNFPHMILLEIEAFLLDKTIAARSKNTLKFYSQELAIFAKLAKSHQVESLEELTPHVLRLCIADLQTRRSKGGLHAFGRALKSFLNWFESENELPAWQNPIRKIKTIGQANREALPGVSEEDIKKLLVACKDTQYPARNRALIYFLYDTGLRVSEVCELTLAEVDLKTGLVHVKNLKGGYIGIAFFHTTCKRELIKYFRHRPAFDPDAPLFESKTGRHLSRRGIANILQLLCTLADIPPVSAHDFRRAFCKAALRKNDVVTVARLMHHRDTSLVMRYTHQSVDDLQQAHNDSSPADNLK